MTTVQSGVTAALTDSGKQTINCLNTLTNIVCVAGVNGEGVGIVWQKNARKKGMEQHPIPIKKLVSSKQPSLISSTRKIQKRKKEAQQKQVRSADLFFKYPF